MVEWVRSCPARAVMDPQALRILIAVPAAQRRLEPIVEQGKAQAPDCTELPSGWPTARLSRDGRGC